MTNPLLTAERFTWIASWPKSGNTYLRLLLQAYQGNGYVDINNVNTSMGDNTEFWFQTVSPIPVDDLNFQSALLLRPAVLFNQLFSINGKKRFIKTHCVNAEINKLPHLIPAEITERAIYIVRDPRDVAISMMTFMDTAEGLTMEQAAEKMNDPDYGITSSRVGPSPLSTWSQHVSTWTNENRYPVAVVRYEDLCANPEKEFAQILAFCEMEVDIARVSRAVKACKIAKLAKQEKEKGFREDLRDTIRKPFFYKGGSRWRSEMPGELARRIEQDHGKMMQQFGYLESNVLELSKKDGELA